MATMARERAGRLTPAEQRIARLERAMAALRRIGDERVDRMHPAFADALAAFADDVVRTRAQLRERGARIGSAAGGRDV